MQIKKWEGEEIFKGFLKTQLHTLEKEDNSIPYSSC